MLSKNIAVLLIALLGVCPSVQAQLSLSQQELKIFQKRTTEKISEFQDALSTLASRVENSETKKIYIEVCLDLFINRGKRVTMEVSSIKSGRETRQRYRLTDYLTRLSNLKQYTKVEMKTAQACTISNFYKKGTDKNGNPIYTAVATYHQLFIGYVEGKPAYRDITQKTVEVELRKSTDIDEQRWIVLLGDVAVAGTKI